MDQGGCEKREMVRDKKKTPVKTDGTHFHIRWQGERNWGSTCLSLRRKGGRRKSLPKEERKTDWGGGDALNTHLAEKGNISAIQVGAQGKEVKNLPSLLKTSTKEMH